MHCVIALDGRFGLHQGRPASHHLTYDRFWTRYLEVFSSVTVIGRLFDTEDNSAHPVEGPGVTFFPLRGYANPTEFFLNRRQITEEILRAVPADAAVIARVPSVSGTLLLQAMQRAGRPYAVEVVADPQDAFAPGAFSHRLRPVFRYWFPRQLRKQCAGAQAAAYVTADALQRRYPCPFHAVGVSDVNIPVETLSPTPRQFSAGGPRTLLSVGSMAQLYKSQDVLIDAVAQCISEGLELRLEFVGDGRHRDDLRLRAADLHLGGRVRFWGQLPAGEAIRERLDSADIFVLPSRQEGLPRAMVEAMARALPCIGSTVGGIPELLPEEDMVPPGDRQALARKIHEVATDPVRLSAMSARNLLLAGDYRADLLDEKRREFYRHVRDITELWQIEMAMKRAA